MEASTNTVIISVVVFVGIIALLLFVRMKLGDRFEVKPTDIMLSLVPVVIWLLLTGKIQKLEYGDLKLEMAFVAATKEPVSSQISELPIRFVPTGMKGSVGQLENIIKSGANGLVFQVGYQNYAGWAIEEYLRALADSKVKYVLFLDPDNRLLGITYTRDLATTLLDRQNSVLTPEAFAEMLSSSNVAGLISMPGVISAKDALVDDATKRTALERMENLQTDYLPVVTKQQEFKGVVEQSRLTASLLIDVASRIE